MRNRIFKKGISLCIMVLFVGIILISNMNNTASAFSGNGSGTKTDPYQITDVYQLQEIQNDLYASYILMNDIDASETSGWNDGAGFRPIGQFFYGFFNGQNFTINNLYINRPSESYVGLFGYVYSYSGFYPTVKDVGLENVNITGGSYYIGGLAGVNNGIIENVCSSGNIYGNYAGGLLGFNGGTVKNSYANGSVNGDKYLGGLVGRNYNYEDEIRLGHIINSYASVDVNGSTRVGGLVGSNEGGTINGSYACGNITGDNYYIGGLVGMNKGTVENSYASGNVSDGNYVGGLVGQNSGINAVVIGSSASGNVYGNGGVGGLVGDNEGGTVENSYSIGNVDGVHSSGGLVGYNINGGTVENSYSSGNVNGFRTSGGIAGLNEGTIKRCYATGNIIGAGDIYVFNIGGLVGGNNQGGVITESFSAGNVSSTGHSIGGLVGLNYGTLENTYATGNVDGDYEVGGLVGRHFSSTLSNSYSTGYVSGNNYAGGLIGRRDTGTVSNCFWDNETSGRLASAGGTGKNTSDMKDVSTYTDTGTLGLDDPWDFVDDPYDDIGTEDFWDISVLVNDGYPFLVTIGVNQPPEACADGPYVADEGFGVIFNASGSIDSDGDVLQYRWDLDNDGIWDTLYSTDPKVTYTWFDDYIGIVKVEVYDGQYTDLDTSTVTINNVAPTIGVLNLPLVPIPKNTLVNLTCNFTDPGWEDIHTATVDWDDGNITTGDIIGLNGSYSVANSWSYEKAGVYTLTLTIEDDDGGNDTEIFQYVVVYNSDAGFVTGGGWIDSPEGAYNPDPNLTGKANFGFVSKYKKGQQNPVGNTEFNFKVADLSFHSDDYDWLVIAGAKAMYKGNGTINNEGNYGFMISAIDEELTKSTDVDLFRIKIWDKDNDDEVIYDNMVGEEDDVDPTTAICGGNIKIHKGE